MAFSQVLVRILGDAKPFEREARRARTSMKGLATEARAMASSQLGGAAAITAIGLALKKSMELADQYEASQRRLAATAKLTGQNLGFLQKTAADARGSFQLSAMTANDLAIEVTKLASKAGAVDKTAQALGAFLEIGAARGLDATATLQAVRQAILGIDEGTDKLFNANPSVLYAEYAKAIGTTAAKLTDAQKAQAILTAAMRDGGKVAGEYAKFLKTPAGEAQKLKVQMEETGIVIGNSLQAARMVVMPALAVMAGGVAEFAGWVQKLGAEMVVGAAHVESFWAKAKLAIVSAVLASSRGRIDLGLADATKGVEAAEQSLRFAREAAADVKKEIANSIALIQEFGSDTAPVFIPPAAVTNAEKIATSITAAADAARVMVSALASVQPVSLRPVGDNRSPIDKGLGRSALTTIGGGSKVHQQAAAGLQSAMRKEMLMQHAMYNAGPAGQEVMQIAQAAASGLGPFALLLPVINSTLEALEPALSAILHPLKTLGPLIAMVLEPALEVFGIVLGKAVKVVTYFYEGLGHVIRGIAAFVNKIVPFGDPLKKMEKFGQEMIDSARATRKAIDANEKLADAAHRTAAALSNVPSIMSIARLRHDLISGGSMGIIGGGGDGAGVVINGPVTVVANNPEQLMEQLGRIAQRRNSRGGTTRMATAVA